MSLQKPFYSLEEIAEMLGVTYQLIYRLVRSGEIPAVRLGRLYRVSKPDLERYLEQSKGAVQGIQCSVCGKQYRSRLSVRQACKTCGDPICNDCWMRRRVRYCTEHGVKGEQE